MANKRFRKVAKWGEEILQKKIEEFLADEAIKYPHVLTYGKKKAVYSAMKCLWDKENDLVTIEEACSALNGAFKEIEKLIQI